MSEINKPEWLKQLQVPFKPHEISKLPKPTSKDGQKGNCKECGGYHQMPAIHLDYVGHAALTKRLLEVDPLWAWEPLSMGEDGLPQFDKLGGLWIRLTVCGHSRLGYGDSQGKSGNNAIKEAIGDALRNAGMRFGMALELWHKGELYDADELRGLGASADAQEAPQKPKASNISPTGGLWEQLNPDEQKFLTEIADHCIGLLGNRDVAGAYDYIEAQKLMQEEKAALWTRFGSAERTAMTKYANSLKKAA